MNLLNFIKSMSYGVLYNTHYGKLSDTADTDTILSLATLIDEGLTRLYSRFCLRERHVILEMQVGVTFYHFNKLYSVQNGDPIRVPYPYIMDLPNDPFQDDLVKVLRVDDSSGVIRPIDDVNQTNSVFMVQYDVLHNPYPRDLEALFVTYQAKHVPIVSFDPTTGDTVFEYEIILPAVLEPALSNYVAYMVHSRINTSESMAKAAGHLGIYEEICKDVERMDLVNSSKSCTNERFDANGWV